MSRIGTGPPQSGMERLAALAAAKPVVEVYRAGLGYGYTVMHQPYVLGGIFGMRGWAWTRRGAERKAARVARGWRS